MPVWIELPQLDGKPVVINADLIIAMADVPTRKSVVITFVGRYELEFLGSSAEVSRASGGITRNAVQVSG